MFVRLGDDYRSDEYYVLTWLEVQEIVDRHYRANLDRHNGVRPKNALSQHTSLLYVDLKDYRDAWHKFRIDDEPGG